MLLQSTLGVGKACALLGALGDACCQSPCAGEGENAESATQGEHSPEIALEADPGAAGGCPCPFDCALGCCSPNRAIVSDVVALDLGIVQSARLPLADVERMPPSPEARGILHVPKLAA